MRERAFEILLSPAASLSAILSASERRWCTSLPGPGYTPETLELLSRGRLFGIGRLQRGNNGVHCRVYRPVRNNDTLPRGLSSRLFRIRFSCRGGFADRDEIDRTGTMDKLGNICDRELSLSSLIVCVRCRFVELGRSSSYDTLRPSATTRSAGRASYTRICERTRITNATYGTACRG